MKILKLTLVLFVLPLVAFTTAHKFYVSVTQIEYVKEQASVQIISRIFVDDLEILLRTRYDENITLNVDKEMSTANFYIEKYLSEKLKIDINGQAKAFTFIGKEYEDDIVLCYMEITDVEQITSFVITNQILQDLFEEQENIVRTHINSKHKSFILQKGNDKGVLNFN